MVVRELIAARGEGHEHVAEVRVPRLVGERGPLRMDERLEAEGSPVRTRGAPLQLHGPRPLERAVADLERLKPVSLVVVVLVRGRARAFGEIRHVDDRAARIDHRRAVHAVQGARVLAGPGEMAVELVVGERVPRLTEVCPPLDDARLRMQRRHVVARGCEDHEVASHLVPAENVAHVEGLPVDARALAVLTGQRRRPELAELREANVGRRQFHLVAVPSEPVVVAVRRQDVLSVADVRVRNEERGRRERLLTERVNGVVLDVEVLDEAVNAPAKDRPPRRADVVVVEVQAPGPVLHDERREGAVPPPTEPGLVPHDVAVVASELRVCERDQVGNERFRRDRCVEERDRLQPARVDAERVEVRVGARKDVRGPSLRIGQTPLSPKDDEGMGAAQRVGRQVADKVAVAAAEAGL
jgi:hypothetical protein